MVKYHLLISPHSIGNEKETQISILDFMSEFCWYTQDKTDGQLYSIMVFLMLSFFSAEKIKSWLNFKRWGRGQ